MTKEENRKRKKEKHTLFIINNKKEREKAKEKRVLEIRSDQSETKKRNRQKVKTLWAFFFILFFRPEVPEELCPPIYRNVMQQCWVSKEILKKRQRQVQ